MTPGPAIECRSVTKRFGDLLVVDDVSFQVPYASVTGFIGANGSGKTTTMRIIAGLTFPTSGVALVAGQRYAELAAPRTVLGAVLNRVGAHPSVTARAHLRAIAVRSGIETCRVEEVLEIVELERSADRRIGTFSTGMTQRCALAAALLGRPSILLLDEPANGLDPGGIRWLRTYLRDAADSGVGVFVSTHQLAELEPIVDHVVVLHEGRCLHDTTPSELLRLSGEARLDDALLALTDLADPISVST